MLEALLEYRSVTRAGEKFGLTQPAASAALAKLREAFADELLVPMGREMKLTPKAERIREPVRQLLALLETTLKFADTDPANWSGEFVLATADVGALLLLPDLIQKLRDTESRLTIRTTNINRASVSNLRNEEIDIIVAPPQIIDDDTLMSRRLFGDRFVVVYSRKHPPADHSLAEYMKRWHIASVIDSPRIGGVPRSFFNPELDTLRATQHNLAVVPYYSLLPLLISDTPWVTLLQESVARRFAKLLPIDYIDPPIELPPINLHMFWSPKYNGDPRHTWLREALVEVSVQYQ